MSHIQDNHCQIKSIENCSARRFVFSNSNVAFVIENILNADDADNFNWYDLIDLSAGDLSSPIKQTITKKAGSKNWISV